MNLNRVKRLAAQLCDSTGINKIGWSLQKTLLFPFIRAINYHDVTPAQAANFEEHLKYYADNFVSVDFQILKEFLQNGEWRHSNPGLIVSFDDGSRHHYETVAPLLEKYNFTGWFFVPIGWLNWQKEQAGKCLETDREWAINYVPNNYGLTQNQLRYLASRHVVGCHTETHCFLSEDVSPEELEREILEAQKHFESVLESKVEIFCWTGGADEHYSRSAAELIKRGYSFSFMTNNFVIRPSTNALQLQRTNVEADNPLWLVRFQLSGILDLAYTGKRRRINHLTA